MSFLVGVRTDFVLGFLSSAGSWILGFVLGKFLDSLGKLAEELAWWRVGAGEKIPKAGKEFKRISPKISDNRPPTWKNFKI